MGVLYHFFYRIAFLATALIHLWWNDLFKATAIVATACLSSPGQPLIRSIVKLHSLVLMCFVLGFCFKSVSAAPVQEVLQHDPTVLSFDDIKTLDGFGDIPAPYHNLTFEGFYAFDPSDPALEGKISPQDVNCAASKPNALYGTRDNFELKLVEPERKPSLQPSNSNDTFTIHRLKLKPLNMPLGAAKVNLQGVRRCSDGSDGEEVLDWSVDFPAGYHYALDVPVKEFSGKVWDKLETLYMWADFHYNGLELDWEFCVDDMEVEID
ncbi:hypothetical protein A1O1_06782 [Capronia coronata CBS 617.96]|uniref:Ubiquitin 3 binding protein But2 C-terminal domain-containing protein n=1 Tax=Capronia coronata CBS 617.96 TaxID=1182541 RepID=W9XSE8_9EURO|nr:uncharacterized protein A1O1_06782 [Capronia coronata CBS 617.96]EXJ83163.1 hypothetical protein A1O1_06782 [Capronia coronata CBS 617.96]